MYSLSFVIDFLKYKLQINIKRDKVHAIALIIMLVVFIFFKPYNLGVLLDEGTFVYRAWRIIEGDTLYKDFFDMRPPGHYLFFFVPIMFIFKQLGLSPIDTLIGLRIVLSLLEIATFYFLYVILTNIIKLDRKISLVLISALIFSPLFLGWGTYLITENIAILPFFAGFYYYLRRRFSLSGALFASSILIRHSIVILLLPIFLNLLVIERNSKKIKHFLLGSLIPTGIVLFFIIATGVFNTFIYQIFKSLIHNKQWFNPPSILFKYEHYLEVPLKLNPAIDLLLILGILTIIHKFRESEPGKLIKMLYLLGFIYWITLFLFASYNTKYIIPFIFISVISAGLFLSNVKSTIKKTLLIFITTLVILQAVFAYNSTYLTDPAYRDNYISPYLSEQFTMSKVLKKYNISDKEWFISHQIIVSFLSQVDSYNHLNIKSDYAFPPREQLLPIFRKIKMVMLDPATKYHLESKSWVNDTNNNLILNLKFKISGVETSENDGFDIYLRDPKTNNIIIIRYHVNKFLFYENLIQINNKRVIIHKLIDENTWNNENIQISSLWLKYYNYIPNKIYMSLVLNADESDLKVQLDHIEIFDKITRFRLYREDFKLIGNTLNMSISNGYYKFRIGDVGNGALSYLNLNYVEVEKIPIHLHQNSKKIVYVRILLNKRFYPSFHKQDILNRILIEKKQIW